MPPSSAMHPAVGGGPSPPTRLPSRPASTSLQTQWVAASAKDSTKSSSSNCNGKICIGHTPGSHCPTRPRSHCTSGWGSSGSPISRSKGASSTATGMWAGTKSRWEAPSSASAARPGGAAARAGPYTAAAGGTDLDRLGQDRAVSLPGSRDRHGLVVLQVRCRAERLLRDGDGRSERHLHVAAVWVTVPLAKLWVPAAGVASGDGQ